MSEAARGRLGRRLQRILLLLPYVIQHPGVTVDELAAKFGIRKRDLLDDLALVWLCGLPGYGPGDLIDASIEDNRVYIRMADYFSAPFRLTPAEALSLYAAGTALASFPGMEEADALRRALSKLGRALGLAEGASGVSVELEGGPADHLEVLGTALEDRRSVRLEYFSATTGRLTSRVVEPWGLVAAVGRWYLVGFDHDSDDERMFRADRIKSVAILDEPADVPEDFDPGRYREAFVSGPSDQVLTLELSPEASRWFGDYYPVESVEPLQKGWTRVRIAAGSERWAALLLLRLGDAVRSVEPKEISDAARRLAETIAENSVAA